MVQVKHTLLARVIHWCFIPLYAYGIFKQLDDLSQLEDTGLLIFEVVFASIFLLIVLMRLFYMKRFKVFMGANVPVHRVHKFFAKSVHISLYACLILLPLTGLIIAALFKQGITDGPMQNIALELHEFSAALSYVLIATHISAAIYSRVKGEGVWSSMVPVLNDEKPTENKIINQIAEIENEIYVQVEKLLTRNKDSD